jgi:hypothetical protein
MKALREYIIEIKESFKDEISLGNDVKLFVDKRFTKINNANVKHTILKTPLIKDSEDLIVGTQILIDTSILYEYLGYKGEVVSSANKLNYDSNLYRLSKNQIYFYLKNDNWHTPTDWVLTKKIKIETAESKSKLIDTSHILPKYETTKVQIISVHEEIQNIAAVDVRLGIPYYIDDQEYLIFKTRDFYGLL